MRNFTYNFLLTFFLCSLVTRLAFSRVESPLVGIDDANIYFIYAKNLANGHGFVYNVGGERVEGFTSLLWTLLSALTFKLSSHPELALLWINVVLLSLGIALALQYLQNDFLGAESNRESRLIYSTVFLLLILSSPRYVVWNTITLMENGLWSILLLITTIFVIQPQPSLPKINLGFSFLSGLLILARPESIVWVALFIAVLLIRMTSTKEFLTALKGLTPAIFFPWICLFLLILFRLQYFGYPFPNTYYAKVSPSFAYNLGQGLGYLAKYTISDPIVLLSITAIVITSLDMLIGMFSKRTPQDDAIFLPLIAGTGLLIPLITGGDHFGSFRLYQNIYPIEVLCLFYFAKRSLPKILGTITQSRFSQSQLRVFGLSSILASSIAFLAFQVYMWNSVPSEINIEFSVADYGRKNGSFIQRLFSPLPELPSLGVVTSGGIKYAYEGEVIDLMGLNNTLMAHNQGDRKGIKNHAAFDIQTFYLLQPDIVWPVTLIENDWNYSEIEIKESWENREGFKGLFDEARFLKLYSYAKITGRASNTYALVAWIKKDLLRELSLNPEFQVEEYEYFP